MKTNDLQIKFEILFLALVCFILEEPQLGLHS